MLLTDYMRERSKPLIKHQMGGDGLAATNNKPDKISLSSNIPALNKQARDYFLAMGYQDMGDGYKSTDHEAFPIINEGQPYARFLFYKIYSIGVTVENIKSNTARRKLGNGEDSPLDHYCDYHDRVGTVCFSMDAELSFIPIQKEWAKKKGIKV